MKKHEECSNCKFWLSRYEYLELDEDWICRGYSKVDLINFKSFGMCRRYPPVVLKHDEDFDAGFNSFNGDATDFFEFVHTEPCDWCGEFIEKT